MKILSKTENSGKQRDVYLHLQPSYFQKKDWFSLDFLACKKAFDIFRHLLFFCDGQSQMRVNTYSGPENVMLCYQNMHCFSWAFLLGFELINLCSFSFTDLQNPGEVIQFLHKVPLHWTVSRANTKSDQSLWKHDGYRHLARIRVIQPREEKTERRHDSSL